MTAKREWIVGRTEDCICIEAKYAKWNYYVKYASWMETQAIRESGCTATGKKWTTENLN